MTGLDPLAAIRAAAGREGSGSSDFDLNPGFILPAGRVLRPAAVLVPFVAGPAGLSVILTKRSSSLKHHPGQIAFPGGKVEETDADDTAAALREAQEEIALPAGSVEVMGHLPVHETVTGFRVTPVLGFVRDYFEPKPEAGEVEEVFSVPFAHLADLGRYSVQSRIWRGQKRFYYTVPFGPYYIWGATARMLRQLAERVAK